MEASLDALQIPSPFGGFDTNGLFDHDCQQQIADFWWSCIGGRRMVSGAATWGVMKQQRLDGPN
jgi:hypothetical protein